MIYDLLTTRISDMYQIFTWRNREEWKEWKDSHINTAYNFFEESILYQSKLPISGVGWCGVCNSWQHIVFTARHSRVQPDGGIKFSYSETAICKNCHSNSRMRASVDILDSLYPITQQKTIYLTEKKTNLFSALESRYSNLIGTEYFADIPLGDYDYQGVRCEDLMSLTFEDNSFSMVGSFDVLEHINDPFRAISEIYRVLEPNGIAVLTFPFVPDFTNSRKRAEIEDGEIIHLHKPVFHGNPISSEGALVFYDIGWDILNWAQEVSGDASIVCYSSFLCWHFGRNRIALLFRKAGH